MTWVDGALFSIHWARDLALQGSLSKTATVIGALTLVNIPLPCFCGEFYCFSTGKIRFAGGVFSLISCGVKFFLTAILFWCS